ncbi:MAG TPA: hypothetical protein VF403_08685 [Kofleriaceae bacterium]
MQRLHTLLLATSLIGVGASIAHADEVGASVSTASASDTDGFVLPKGKLLLDAQLEMSLSSGAVFKPVSLAPDLWYGVTDDLSLGLVHSSLGETGFIGAAAGAQGDSLCLTGAGTATDPGGCPNFYNKVGIDGRYRLKKPLALDVGLYINSINDPFLLDLKIGIDGRWTWDKVSLELQPSIFIGLTNRTPPAVTPPAVASGGNTEVLFIPATLAYRVAPKADIALQAGLALPFSNTSDTWTIPLAIAARYALTPKFGLGLAFAFPELIGGNSTAKIRSLTLGGTYAF